MFYNATIYPDPPFILEQGKSFLKKSDLCFFNVVIWLRVQNSGDAIPNIAYRWR